MTSRLSFFVALLGAAAATVPAHAASVRDGYTAPQITLPYAFTKPKIDGVIGAAEWNGAASLNALQTTNKALSARQTRFWLSWDEENVYLAMRTPLRQGERLIRANRETGRDINVVFDDSYEIWLDAGTNSPDGQPVFFQFLSNFDGARYDVMQEPAVGNSRLGWTSGWKPANRLSGTAENRAWEMELAIPRRTLYLNHPLRDGFQFSALLARNFKRPWEQNTLAGTGSFSVRESYARFKLSKSAPALHLDRVGDAGSRRLGVALQAVSPAGKNPQPLQWYFESDSGVKHSGNLYFEPGKSSATLPWQALDEPGQGAYRIRVNQDQNTLLDWSASREWGGLEALTEKIADHGEQVELALDFNPVRNYLRVRGDLINYDNRNRIRRYELRVTDSSNKRLLEKSLRLDPMAYVRDVALLPNLGAGEYTATLEALDAAGKRVFVRESKFSKKDPKQFAWWKTPLGNADKVLSPWTPVQLKGNRLDVWGRAMRVGTAGLPSQITTQNLPFLAAPARLEVQLLDGSWKQAGSVALKTVSKAPHRAILAADGKLSGASVHSRVTTEYDGMYKVDLKLDPGSALKIQKMRIVLPIRPERAEYLHATGEGIRYGFDYRFLPKDKTGRIWDSTKVDGQPMRQGSFIPYLWIGDTRGGLCWFADSDQGWAPDNNTPAIEIRRDSKSSTDLVLNLVSKPETLKAPRAITFGLQATPVKPIHQGWRMDSWWTNDSFQDWAQVESKGGAGDMGLIFSSLPFPLDPAQSREMVAARHKNTNSHIFGLEKYRANAVPYFEHINMGSQFVPEFPYFAEEWKTNVSRGLAYGPSLTDFMIYHLSHWIKDANIDGFYVDNVYPIADDNIQAGRGYRLPNGQVQPTYQMFETRRYFLRMRAAFLERGKRDKLVVHMTNNMIIPWVGATDIALDGEHHVIYPEMNKDFMDFWSLERLRVDFPAQWGVAVNFLQEYQGDWDQAKLKKAMRAYTGMMLLHDVLPSANANGLNPEVWRARDRFGLENKDVNFVAPWQAENGLKSGTSGVHLSAWKRPGKTLVAVVNTGEAQTAAVRLDSTKLGLGPAQKWRVEDAETGEVIPVTASGHLQLPLSRHDYRLLSVVSGESFVRLP